MATVDRGGDWSSTRASLPVAHEGSGCAMASGRNMCQFICDASTVLHDSLDYGATLERAARLAVPFLADACEVEHSSGPSDAPCLAVASSDPACGDVLRDLRREVPSRPGERRTLFGPAPDGPRAVPVTARVLAAVARDGAHLRQLQALRLRWAIFVPLQARGRRVGTMTLLSCEARSGGADLPIAEEYARRVTVALENARQHAEALEEVRRREVQVDATAHELRAPLTALQLHVGRLLEAARAGKLDAAASDRFVASLAAAERQGRRMARLIGDLLDTARITTGRFEVSHERFSLGALVDEVVAAHEATNPRHPILWRGAAREATVHGDRARIEQVVSNLLDNAIKYSPDGGEVQVTLDVHGGESVLAVADRGIGVPADQRERLFERFFRCANVPRGCTGLGLGLFLCHEIVVSHGGRIWVDSESGRGSTFYVALPQASPGG